MDVDVLAMIVAVIEHFWVAVARMPKSSARRVAGVIGCAEFPFSCH